MVGVEGKVVALEGKVVVLVDKVLAVVMAGNISSIFHIVPNSVHRQK